MPRCSPTSVPAISTAAARASSTAAALGASTVSGWLDWLGAVTGPLSHHPQSGEHIAGAPDALVGQDRTVTVGEGSASAEQAADGYSTPTYSDAGSRPAPAGRVGRSAGDRRRTARVLVR